MERIEETYFDNIKRNISHQHNAITRVKREKPSFLADCYNCFHWTRITANLNKLLGYLEWISYTACNYFTYTSSDHFT